MTAPEFPSSPQQDAPGPEQAYDQQPPHYDQPYDQTYGQQAPQPSGWQPMPGAPGYGQYAPPQGPIGQVRPTGMIMLLFFVTLGIWSFIYYFQTHEEMKRHTGEGVGGVIAVLIAFFAGIVNPYLLSYEVGQLYTRRGQEPPVSALTGLWFFPGMLILVGPFVWFIETNRALNDYWKSLGARGSTLV
jgi:hypothetical protein